MVIITQTGKSINACEFSVSDKIIKCTPTEDKRRRIVCGEYKDRKRATQVFMDMLQVEWDAEYVMPIE